ncbi:hypothetical protein FRC05_010613 [Tulasnella sp. 425]|nr:hypothetical protein FRC05_010613 [Tulasnella sp. 425]
MSRASLSFEDPFERFLRPPPGETPEEKAARLQQEEEAKRINAEIEEALKAERAASKRRRAQEVSVLLLGESGPRPYRADVAMNLTSTGVDLQLRSPRSGKTTTLKQLLLNFSDTVFAEERASWRAVVFLNVITSFKIILQALERELESSSDSSRSPADDFVIQLDGGTTARFAEMKMRLSPVLHIESTLAKKLNGGTDWPNSKDNNAAPQQPAEVSVRGQAWKKAFQSHRHHSAKATASDGIDWDDREDPGVILNACRNEMIALWNNPRVREVLRKQKILLEDSGFFLDQLDRITGRRFVPTDDDILRARLKTVGASEHTFTMTSGPEKGMTWKIYDVGGSRTQRPSWAPFFDDVDAILCLAPISAYDQVLTEDKRVNRLEDSINLWIELCGNKILAKVPLILFLNKIDLLKAKLESGVSVKKYVPSYGDRKNDFPTASQCQSPSILVPVAKKTKKQR